MVEETETSLLDRADVKAQNYEWDKAARLYEQVAKVYLGKKMLEDAANFYTRAGDTYLRAVKASETKEEYIDRNKDSVESYQKAERLYKQIDNNLLSLECKVKANIALTLVTSVVDKRKNALKESINICLDLNKIYSNKDDNKNFIKISILTLNSISYFLMLSEKPSDFSYYIKVGYDIFEKAWSLLKDIDNVNFRADLLYWESFLIVISRYTEITYGDEKEHEIRLNFLLKCEETLDKLENIEDISILAQVYSSVGLHFGMYGTLYIEDQNESLKLAEKGFDLLEKSLIFHRKTKNYIDLIQNIYTLDYLAGIFGRFEYYQKRVLNDVHEVQKLSKIYDGFYTHHGILISRVSIVYYYNFASKSFLKDDIRKTYANLGIKHAKKSLNQISFGPFFPLTYQMLSQLYSQLVILATDEDPQEEYVQSMFYNTDMAEHQAEGYKGGTVKSAEFYSKFRANKTMVEISKNNEDKIRYLEGAIEAAKTNIKFSIESYRLYLAAQIRLGQLYEELGILTNVEKPLMEAKQLFLHIIRESSKKGYYYYTAACYEYIARLEDRLGNHITSAEYYEKAKRAHEESLLSIEYKLLKDRVNEKIEYAIAWSIIEKAKDNHKKEKHLEARNNYEKASEILKNFSAFNHEASYFSSWAILEEAEQLSKEEKFEEAINSYERANELFDTAKMVIRYYRKNIKRSVEIKRLEKVASLRMNYCSARVNLEKARILAKKGDHIEAAEKFAIAANQFKNICSLFRVERERGELKAVYHLCKAWENMELAEKTENPSKYSNSGKLFLKASELFIDSKLKYLALGNSHFCLALEIGCNFDRSNVLEEKANLYLKVKSNLRNASDSYEKGGFKNAADWALATSTYFDAAWHLIQADNELRIDRRKVLLDIGVSYLESAAGIFIKAGYKNKEKEVLERIKRMKREEKILISALNTIKKPSISGSIEGIVAPSCPIEISQSPKIGEIQQYAEEVSTFLEKDKMETVLTNKIKIFVSYSTLDSNYFQVSNIANLLTENPDIEKVFYWEEDLQDDIFEYMNKNLAMCDIFLIFCSTNANQSEPVQMEWQAALKIKKKIIPIFISESDIPPLLSTKLGVQFDKNNIEKIADQIYRLILKKLNI